jgi:hypothetical protein
MRQINPRLNVFDKYKSMGNIINPYIYLKTDVDANAFISAAGLTDQNQKIAITNLVVGLKDAGLWAKMKAVYPFVGGIALSHKWNLKDPRDLDAAFRLTFYGGIAHSQTGVLPNGTSGYADTYLSPSVSLSSSSVNVSFYSRSNIAGSGNVIDIGTYLTSINNMYLCVYRTSDNTGNFAAFSDNQRISYASSSKLGLFSGNLLTTSKQYIVNGVVKASASILDGTIPNQKVFIFALNISGAASLFAPRECAFSSIGDGLTTTDSLNLYNIVQQYQTTLGRQV